MSMPVSYSRSDAGANLAIAAASDACPIEWNVALITSRESPEELLGTIDAIAASVDRPTLLDVLVNGNQDLAAAMVELLAQRGRVGPKQLRLRLWSLKLGDKASTWNQYLHMVWPGGEGTTFFVDGHCQPSRGGLAFLDQALANAPRALAASAVPGSGRSARQWREHLLREGGLVGGFLALRSEVMAELKQRGFRLPLGLYGFDATLGAVFAFGMDPAVHPWDLKGRITAHTDATWYTVDKRWWRLSDLRTQWRRMVKVALRVLVGQAIRDAFAIRKLQPEQLPRTTAEFVLDWASRRPAELWRAYRRSPLSVLALRQLRQHRDWSAADVPPDLLLVLGADGSTER